MDKAFTQGDYSGCISHCNTLLAQCPKDDTAYWNTLSYLAFSHFYLQDFESARVAQAMERELRQKFQGTSHEYYLSATFYLGVFSSYAADYETSIVMMEEVKMPYKNLFGEKSESYLNVLRSLAGLYDQTGSDYLAEKYYDTLYAIVKANFTPHDEMLKTVSNSASAFYTMSGAFEKAEPFFLDAVSATESYYGKYNDTSLASFNSLGEFYIYAGWYAKAEEIYLEFVARCLKHYGKKSADYGTALNNLAVAYEKQNKYPEAEKCYQECLKVKGALYTYESAYYALSLQNLAVLYDNMGRQQEAEELLNQAIGIYELVYDDHENYATALNNLASIYSSNGKLDKAIEIQTRSCEIQKKNYGENSSGFVNALGNLAEIYLLKGDLHTADSLMLKSAELKKTVLGANHPDYAITLCNLGNIKSQLGEHNLALDLYTEALTIQANTIGMQDRQYAVTLTSMAGTYFELGDYQRAEKMYQNSCSVMKKSIGERDPEFATVLCNYGIFYQATGNLDKAEILFNQAYSILTDARGFDHPDLIYPLTSLARNYVQRNYYEKAENYLEKSLVIAATYYGERHVFLGSLFSTLGELYTHLGQFDKAQGYYQRAVDINGEIYGTGHAEYATSLNNLGTLYIQRFMHGKTVGIKQSAVDSAVACFEGALRVDTLRKQLNHPDHAGHLNNLAELYLEIHDFKTAKDLFMRALEIEESTYDKDNLSTVVTRVNLGLAHEDLKDYQSAMDCYRKGMEIRLKAFGPKSSLLVNNYLHIANLSSKTGEFNNALQYFTQALNLSITDLERNIGFLTEEAKANYYTIERTVSRTYYSYLLSHPGVSPESYDIAYTSAMREKGILLRSSERMKNAILTSGDAELISLYDRWISKKQELAQLLSQDQRGQTVTVDGLESEAQNLEKQLISRSSDFRDEMSGHLDLNLVKSALAGGEVAIEFVQYDWMDSITLIGSTYYGALLFRHDSPHPVLIELCAEDSILTLMNSQSGSNEKIVGSVYGNASVPNVRLHQLVWQPIEKHLTGIKTVYYSPVGELHKISFSALRNAQRSYLADRYQLHQVATTAGIAEIKNSSTITRTDQLCVFGGAQFSTENSAKEIWSYLEGTKTEADQIYELAVSSKLPCQEFTGLEASEVNIKDTSITSDARLLHIATHGYFYQMDTQLDIAIEESSADLSFRGAKGVTSFIKNPNPLMRSGLVFSGANDVWNESSNKNGSYSEDGVLTAMEVCNLDLDHIKLVVLSACETGLGDIAGTQGVYGLQRAFKIAGVDKMIMSLWQVPDKETAEFMILFYKNLFTSYNVHVAFSKAQATMRLKYDPYFWGAFVLIE